jgi:protocatechuate 3,4-dioxygenase, alpha subunit
VTLGQTPSQTVGPFYTIGLCRRSDNELVEPGSPAALELTGRLVDGQGVPIVDGMVEVWDGVGRRWGRSGTDGEGRYSFIVAKPPAQDGRAPRLDVFVFARGLLRHQLTRLYFSDEPEANGTDPVLSALPERERETLVARRQGDVVLFDITMQGESATVFFAH